MQPRNPLARLIERLMGGEPRGMSLAGPHSSAEAALTPLERELLPALLEIQETPPSPSQRRVLWVLTLLVLCFLVWSCIGKVAIVSTAPGKFIPDGRVKQLQPLEAAIVREIHVIEGAHVQQGDLLLELDPTIDKTEVEANAAKVEFNRLEQDRLGAELSRGAMTRSNTQDASGWRKLEEQTMRARAKAYAAKLAQAKATVTEKAQALAAAEATLHKYQETTVIAEEREESARPLVDSGALSRLDYLQLKQALEESGNDLVAQKETVKQAKAAEEEATENVEQVIRDRNADILNDMNQRVTSEPGLKGDLDKAKELLALKWLRAPVSGIVQKIDVTTIGQVVTSGQVLVTIVPDGMPLIVEATLTNQDIGYVKLGQPVEVKVDTFPFQKYGSLKGVVAWISADAEDKESAARDLDVRTGAPMSEDSAKAASNPNTGYVYKVHVRTNTPEFVIDGQPRSIQAGMTVQADIVTDRRRIIDFFLSPVEKYLNEGLTVR
jgi:hemolysin D